ncbi:MAG: YicC family protein [Verrucomicrobia bacterium]|nr:YicC family protein [Verrucomicrobiota bacterium]
MTGYGRGECAQDGFKITVELSSVNRRQSDISVNLPRELEPLESRLRDEINRGIARGRLTVRVSLHSADEKAGGKVRLNAALARAYAREFRKLARSLKLTDPVSLELLARAPGVLQTDEPVTDADDFWPAVEKATQKALTGLVKMREREGAHLAHDLKSRMAVIRQSVARVRKQAPEVAKRYQEQLRERIKNAGLEVPGLEDERLLKEVIYFADRSDVSEEITRLESHFQQFEDCLKSREPVGRTLDFLSQEMNREINTLGAKANDSLISREVVVLKAELEKFREQAQNVE